MDGTQDQTETHDQPKIPAEIPAKITTEVKKERIKNPKRVEQGKKLAEWNKANKKRLSRRQLETQSESHCNLKLLNFKLKIKLLNLKLKIKLLNLKLKMQLLNLCNLKMKHYNLKLSR